MGESLTKCSWCRSVLYHISVDCMHHHEIVCKSFTSKPSIWPTVESTCATTVLHKPTPVIPINNLLEFHFQVYHLTCTVYILYHCTPQRYISTNMKNVSKLVILVCLKTWIIIHDLALHEAECCVLLNIINHQLLPEVLITCNANKQRTLYISDTHRT